MIFHIEYEINILLDLALGKRTNREKMVKET